MMMREDRELPEHLREIDERLRRTRFRPRPSLLAKIASRLRTGGGESDRAHGPRGHRPPRGMHGWRRPLIATAAAVLGGLALWGLAGDGIDGVPEIDDVLEIDELVDVDDLDELLSADADDAGPADLSGIVRQARGRIDRCCADLDGGDDKDDGVLVLVGPDEAVLELLIYEDQDGSGDFSAGDPVRIGPDHPPARGELAWAGLVALDRCCLDYDAGGPEDDGLFLVGQPPDRLLMAAVYEDRDGDGVASSGDLVRYVIR